MTNLEKNLARLKELQKQKNIIEEEITTLQKKIQKTYSRQDRVNIFSKLFINRFDKYAKLWQSKDKNIQKFYPATKTFRGEDYLFLDDFMLEEHLLGKVVLATYILNQKNESKYLVLKTPKAQKLKLDFLLKDLEIFVYYEKISLNYFHAWIFFDDFISSCDLLNFCALIFSKLKTKFPSYPSKTFTSPSEVGEVIALPLQFFRREASETIFFDIENEKPIKNTWAFLDNVKRNKSEKLKTLLGFYDLRADKQSEDENKIEKNKELILELSDRIYLSQKYLNKKISLYLKNLVSFENPQIKILLKLRKPLFGVDRILKDFEENEKYLILPRGVLDKIKVYFEDLGLKYSILDKRKNEKSSKILNLVFSPKEEQKISLKNILKYDFSVCVAPPGFGKTFLASSVLANRGVKTLVLVNKNILLEQWIERFMQYFNLEKKDIGFLAKSKNTLNGELDVASMQSLKNSLSLIKNYSFVIVDECHHIPAFSFENIIKNFCGKYLLGLSATPMRKDGLEKILYHQLGKISYEHKNIRTFNNKVFVIKSDFRGDFSSFASLLTALCKDEKRNTLLCDLILKNQERKILLLSDRIEHLNILSAKLQILGKKHLVLHGQLAKKVQEKAMKEAGSAELILASSSFFGEGMDFAHLNTIIFATPISFYARLVQYLGRIGRSGEECLAFDILDSSNAMLKSSFNKRKLAYKKMFYNIIYDKL